MKKLLFTLILLAAAQNMLRAQYLLHNKLVMDVSAQYFLGIGPSTIINEAVEIPGLIGNMDGGVGYSITAKYRPKKGIGGAITYSSVLFNQWTSPNSSDLFAGSSLSQISIKPGLMIATPFADRGSFNRLTLSGILGPAIGLSSVTFGDSFIWHGYQETKKVNSQGTQMGAFADATVSYAVSRSVEIHANLGYTHFWKSNAVLLEKSYGLLYAGAGLSFRFMIDKNFLYE